MNVPKAVCKNKFFEYCYTFVDEFLYKNKPVINLSWTAFNLINCLFKNTGSLLQQTFCQNIRVEANSSWHETPYNYTKSPKNSNLYGLVAC